jgi:hypothetical protein
LRQKYANYEIIVSDNCSTDSTRQVIEKFEDRRIRYITPERRLSMAGNFDFALKHADPGFVMFIGADDGVMPGAIDYVAGIAEGLGVRAVSCRQATYIWPSFPDADISGRLIFGGLRDDVEIRKSAEWLPRTLDFDCTYIFELPNLYCGFVHTEVIEKAIVSGRYFRSITPDAYSAFATAVFLDSYAFSHRPFVVAGASPKSNGASGMNPKSSGRVAEQFKAENDLEFHRNFVSCQSYEVIAAEAFAQLADAFPDACSPYRINLRRLFETSVARANSRTEPAIREAVGRMIEIHAVPDVQAPTKKASTRTMLNFATLIRVVRDLLIFRNRYTGVNHSDRYCIDNIDDAVIVAKVLSELDGARDFETVSRMAVRAVLARLN